VRLYTPESKGLVWVSEEGSGTFAKEQKNPAKTRRIMNKHVLFRRYRDY
jgi:hypothetical protein